MQAAESALFKGLHMKFCIIAKLSDILSAVNAEIALAYEMCKRYLHIIAQPAYCRRIHSHIAQNESPVRTKNTAHTVKKALRVGVVVKAFTAYHHIERVVGKWQFFAVSDYELHIFHVLALCGLYHFRSKVNARVVLVGVFFIQQSKHWTRSAAAVQKVGERLFFKLCQYFGIVLFTQLVNPCLVRFIYLRGLGKFLYR